MTDGPAIREPEQIRWVAGCTFRNDTSIGQKRYITELLEVERHQLLQTVRMNRRDVMEYVLDRGPEVRECRLILPIHGSPFGEPPQSLDAIQVRRV